jgi:transcription factor IIIB subunit 2
MAEFIKSLAVSFGATGLSPRATALFNQTRSATNFRWGKKSRTVAAACLAIALRESNRPDCLRDLALLLKVPPTLVSREFMSVTSALKLSLSSVDPTIHISTLQTHLAFTLKERASDLPVTLLAALRTLCLRSATNTAISLSQVLMRLSPDHDVLRLPVPPTACGMFILALESEHRAVLNPLADLAECLGSRCHVAKSVVMARYKTIQDEIALWVQGIPWLDKYESKKGRAKVSKRLIVARGLKDVIQFQEEIWQQKTMPTPELELSDVETDGDEQSPCLSPSRPRKRPKLNHALSQATRFLLDPLGTSVSSIVSAPPNETRPASENPSSRLLLAAYILANPASLTGRPPTRLQLLALDRGGVNEDQIPDEELFADGEFEKILRTEEEVEALRETFGWKEDDDIDETITLSNKGTGKTRVKRAASSTEDEILQGSAFSPRKKSRLNMEALARFLGGDGDEIVEGDTIDSSLMGLEEVVNQSDEEETRFGHDDQIDIDEDDDSRIVVESSPSLPRKRPSSTRRGQEDADLEVIVENWRPPTPEHAVSDSRYEEEYD